MSLITSSAAQSNISQNKNLYTRNTYASTYGSGDLVVQLPILTETTHVIVKIWGAGGCPGLSGNGGGAGYTTYTFAPIPGSSYYISVGLSGAAVSTGSGGSILRGGTVNTTLIGGSGGDGSLLARLTGSTYTLLAVAGGGGGGSGTNSQNGGPGGGGSGGSGVSGGGGGSNGSGGSGTGNSGSSCSLTATSLANFGGSGGNSINNNAGAGGGGYGGGGSNSTAGGGGGGGGFVNTTASEYISGSTTAGSGTTTANTGDADYFFNFNGGDGGGGYIVVYTYRYCAVVFKSSFKDNTSPASSVNSVFDANLMPIPVLSSANATVTTTNASTCRIIGPPIQGTNTTITNAFSLRTDSGSSYFSGMSIMAFPVYITLYNTQTYYNASGTSLGTSVSTTSAYYYTRWASNVATNFPIAYHGNSSLIVPYSGIYILKYTFANGASGSSHIFISYNLNNNTDLDGVLQTPAVNFFSSVETTLNAIVRLNQNDYVSFGFYLSTGSVSWHIRSTAEIALVQRTA